MDKYYLTEHRLKELREELSELKTKKRGEIAERLKNAKDYGDLSENSEYTEAREEQARVEARIFELEDVLKRVAIIERNTGSEEVKVGCLVTVRKDNQSHSYTIVGPNETEPEKGKISNESPLGKALMGHEVGDKINFKTPGGEVTYEISKIE
ncbi:MAG: transcription elongation factor GreA [Parcubacteria group bacterium Gr01-1014_20]|nr:MAG: transcription elongation factor GreA [Parcubacteria group bacterium Gr01-1014_20]